MATKAQIQLISDIIIGYSEFLSNRNFEDEDLSNVLVSKIELSTKLEDTIKYINKTYPDCCIENQWPPDNYKSQCIHRLYIMIIQIQKELQKPEQKLETVEDILMAKYSTYVDHAPTWINIIKCEPTFTYNFPDHLNLNLKRAHKIKDLHFTLPLIPKLIEYLSTDDYEYNSDNILPKDVYNHIMEEKTLEELKDLCEEHSIRYIKEMTIEYNQIEKREELIKLYVDKTHSIDYILELLKEKYYSKWGNEKDFIWIAKNEPDYIKEYDALNKI